MPIRGGVNLEFSRFLLVLILDVLVKLSDQSEELN